MQKPKILITGASGKTGYPAAKELLELGFPVGAFVRNAESAKTTDQYKKHKRPFSEIPPLTFQSSDPIDILNSL